MAMTITPGEMMKHLYQTVAVICLYWSATLSAQDSLFHTMILAASCAACHGPQGNSLGVTPALAGLDKEYFLQRMQGFKQGSIPATVMHHHAKGLTDEEIASLADYFAAQPTHTPTPAPQQAFKGEQ